MTFWLKLGPTGLRFEKAIASSSTSATSFELVEDQRLTEEEIALAEMELENRRFDRVCVWRHRRLSRRAPFPRSCWSWRPAWLASCLRPWWGAGRGPHGGFAGEVLHAGVDSSRGKPWAPLGGKDRAGYHRISGMPATFPAIPSTAAFFETAP